MSKKDPIIFSLLAIIVITLYIFVFFINIPHPITRELDKQSSQLQGSENSSKAESSDVRQPGPTAKFKIQVNDDLYQYYPLAVGNKWVYKSWTYTYKNYNDDIILVKENSELTVKIDKIYEEAGKEYVELGRILRVVGLQEIEEPSASSSWEVKIIRDIPLPKDEETVFNTTAILEISGTTVNYLKPAYPNYIDNFPLKEGIITDLNSPYIDRWQSVYGEDAMIWKRKKADDYNIEANNKNLTDCYISTVYDLRGNSGSREEITFCQGVGPVKYVSEMFYYLHHSYYDDLIDFDIK